MQLVYFKTSILALSKSFTHLDFVNVHQYIMNLKATQWASDWYFDLHCMSCSLDCNGSGTIARPYE